MNGICGLQPYHLSPLTLRVIKPVENAKRRGQKTVTSSEVLLALTPENQYKPIPMSFAVACSVQVSIMGYFFRDSILGLVAASNPPP